MFDERRVAYGGFMLAALVVFIVVRRWISSPDQYRQIPWNKRCALGLAAFGGGVFGARLPFAMTGTANVFSGVAWAGDGKTIMTGLAGAYLAVELAKRLLGIRVKTGDTWAVPLAAALAIGRWGCFFNGCCHGVACGLPWGVDFGDGVMRHPTQIYESLFHGAMIVVLIVLLTGPRWTGHRLQFYLISYCVFRFATEFIRPEPTWFAGLTFYQWVALAMAIALACQWRRED